MSKLDSIVVDQIAALLTDEQNSVANLANASALLYDALPVSNWCGFYLLNEHTGELDLGPFQGKVACMHIKPGTGVVGASFAQNNSVLVPDVHEFPGHIACDAASNSEVVIPLRVNNRLIGVLDIDSPDLNTFSAEDLVILEQFSAVLGQYLDADVLTTV